MRWCATSRALENSFARVSRSARSWRRGATVTPATVHWLPARNICTHASVRRSVNQLGPPRHEALRRGRPKPLAVVGCLDLPHALIHSSRVKRLLLPLAVCLFAAPAAAQTTTGRAPIDRAITAVYPSLVRISVVVVESRDGREINVEASGSGTIVSTDGYVV